MTFPRELACLSVIDTGSTSVKETIELKGRAEKPADSGAVVGKGSRICGLEVRWSDPGLAHRRWRSRSKHANAIERPTAPNTKQPTHKLCGEGIYPRWGAKLP